MSVNGMPEPIDNTAEKDTMASGVRDDMRMCFNEHLLSHRHAHDDGSSYTNGKSLDTEDCSMNDGGWGRVML